MLASGPPRPQEVELQAHVARPHPILGSSSVPLRPLWAEGGELHDKSEQRLAYYVRYKVVSGPAGAGRVLLGAESGGWGVRVGKRAIQNGQVTQFLVQ